MLALTISQAMLFMACSKDNLEQATSGVSSETSDTRADLIEYTIDNLEAGTLLVTMKEMDIMDAQKLIISGTISSADIDSLEYNTSVVSLDLSKAELNDGWRNCDYVPDYFFIYSKFLTEIILPENVTSINSFAFGFCSSLTSIHIPDGVTSIGFDAFYECSLLTNINIPNGITSIEGYAFERCSSLTDIHIPNGVTIIKEGVFEGCSSLVSVNIPDDVTEIGAYAFAGCSSLTSIHIPDGVTSIEDHAFYGCKFTDIKIPDGVTVIKEGTFYGCALTSIDISNIVYIGEKAFKDCESLTNIDIPDKVEFIGNEAFYGCNSLKIIDWHTTQPLSGAFDNFTAALFIYTNNDSLPDGYEAFKSVAIDGAFDTLDITTLDASCAPYLTTAKKVIFTKDFSSEAIDAGGRWYSLSLPFVPTEITHEEKGLLAPFDSDVTDAKNFWLRELTQDGFQDVTSIEANHAYVIAMPNSNQYADEFNISGTVTFSAENVEFNGQAWEPIVSEGATYSMYPVYEDMDITRDIYVLNSDYWVNGFDYGSVFVHGAVGLKPYEAYIKYNDGGATMRSVLPIMDGKRTAVRGSNDASSRGAYGHQKPRKEDM
jgi:hypothetical protein